MKITGFRIAGFKSFADPVEVSIAPGMTGIVGPNGCGKSNVIESFRWSMGEASAKSMRADSMDDVIFGGTDLRAPKGFCEVVTIVDNSDRKAPVEFNDCDILEVSRRLDRGDGSSYKVNGKPVKAKDVRVLFKDAGIGASSSALVSQGKVGAIISAKPIDRKQVLEEAAGVTGLASRRHEADLRLRATEQNLEQAENLEKGLSDQQASLRRQARQAKFKQEVDDLIRAAEATAFLVRWNLAASKFEKSQEEHVAVEVVIKDLMLAHQHRQAEMRGLSDRAAPALKARSDAEMAHALALAGLDTLRKDLETARRQFAAVERNMARAASDLLKNKQEIGDSAEEYERLKDDVAILKDDKDYDAVLIEEAMAVMVETQERFEEASMRLSEAAEKLAAVKVEWQAASRSVDEMRRRADQSRNKLQTAKDRLLSAVSELQGLPAVSDLTASLQHDVEAADAAYTACQESRVAAQNALIDENAVLSSNVAALSVLRSELSALNSSRGGTHDLMTDIRVSNGYENAFSAAFLGEMASGLSACDGNYWQTVTKSQSHPDGCDPLSRFVEAPRQLQAAINAVGVWVQAGDPGLSEVERLLPGQSIVTISGRRFRWDGFSSVIDDVEAEALKRMQRIKALDAEIALGSEKVGELEKSVTLMRERVEAALAEEKSSGEAAALARSLQHEHRQKQAELETRRLSLATLIETLEDSIRSYEEDCQAEAEELERLMEVQNDLPGLEATEADVSIKRQLVEQEKNAYEANRKAVEQVRRNAEVRLERIKSSEQKIIDFDRRIVQTRQHIQELEERQGEYIAEQVELQEVIDGHPEREELAAENLEVLSEQLVSAAKEAQDCEQQLEAARLSVQKADEGLALRREDRARIVAEIKAAQDAVQELRREVEDRLSVTPDKLVSLAGLEEGVELPDLATCEGRVQGLHRRREAIGAVNPLAEQHLKDVEDKLGKANAARDELRSAVRRLRDQITAFDRERRERLIEAFAAIDGHFRELFTRVFGGGRAFLKLSGSDDPLEAGLEIFASPPGKNLQSMTLLSGGEQAMTALALIFAAFLIRPAPVCVLDEVDAALDDANIDRLCRLVEELAGEQTRFLVITHRSLTMSRCDRLYGVTMAEKGVSKLTTLDMEEAVAYVQARQGGED